MPCARIGDEVSTPAGEDEERAGGGRSQWTGHDPTPCEPRDAANRNLQETRHVPTQAVEVIAGPNPDAAATVNTVEQVLPTADTLGEHSKVGASCDSRGNDNGHCSSSRLPGSCSSTCSIEVPHSDNASTVAPPSPQSSMSSHMSSELMRSMIRIQPCRKYAHSNEDAYLLSCFLDISKVLDIDGESTKLLLRTLKFLRACDFSSEDICSVLAHASVYFEDTYELCGRTMDASEVGNVLALLIFVAHSYVQDETCKLHVWHKYLFRKYCTLHVLNAAILRLLEIRKYMLRIGDEVLATRYKILLSTASPRQRWPRGPDPGGTIAEAVQPEHCHSSS